MPSSRLRSTRAVEVAARVQRADQPFALAGGRREPAIGAHGGLSTYALVTDTGRATAQPTWKERGLTVPSDPQPFVLHVSYAFVSIEAAFCCTHRHSSDDHPYVTLRAEPTVAHEASP